MGGGEGFAAAWKGPQKRLIIVRYTALDVERGLGVLEY